MERSGFYEAAAQVIPVLALVFVFELRYLLEFAHERAGVRGLLYRMTLTIHLTFMASGEGLCFWALYRESPLPTELDTIIIGGLILGLSLVFGFGAAMIWVRGGKRGQRR
jgi:hypothetical protein